MTEANSIFEDDVGYVYVLTNPAIPGKLKIGRTGRHPTQRAQELSSATGVPVSFEVAFYMQFLDCILAEKLVHLELSSGAAPIQKNKEFFTCDISVAKGTIEAVHSRIAQGALAEDSLRLRTEANQLLASPRQTTGSLSQALICLEYAFQLGDTEAGYLAAQTAQELMGRKAENSSVAKQLEGVALALFRECADRGVVRGWAELALVHHNKGDANTSELNWNRFFQELALANYPATELRYLLKTLEETYFSNNISAHNLPFLKNNKSIVLAVKKYPPKNLDYQLWLIAPRRSITGRVLDRLRLPTLYATGVGLLWLTRPSLVPFVLLGTVGYLWVARKKNKSRKNKRK